MSWFNWKKPVSDQPAEAASATGPKKSWWTQTAKWLATAQAQPINPNNNFTPRSIHVLALAGKEARRLNHEFVGTEHVLLGLIKYGKGIAINVMQQRHLDLEDVRKEVEKRVFPPRNKDQPFVGNIPYTPRVKSVLRLAMEEAELLNHYFVGTEHLLLGLLRETDGLAAKVLKDFKIELQQTREDILKELDSRLDGGESNENGPPTAPA